MNSISNEAELAFYSGKRRMPEDLVVNDAVEVLDGPNSGKYGAGIAFQAGEREMGYVVELSDGKDVVLSRSSLRRKNGAT